MNAQKSNCTIQSVKLHSSEASSNQTKSKSTTFCQKYKAYCHKDIKLAKEDMQRKWDMQATTLSSFPHVTFSEKYSNKHILTYLAVLREKRKEISRQVLGFRQIQEERYTKGLNTVKKRGPYQQMQKKQNFHQGKKKYTN